MLRAHVCAIPRTLSERAWFASSRWWRSFLTSGSSAGYMFAYSVFYFFTKLEITKFVSALLYFGYMSIAALVFFVSTGTIGFYACHIFVWKIFSAIKVD